MFRACLYAILVSAAMQTAAFACSCAGLDAKTTFKLSTEVFVGEVVETTSKEVTFRVVRRFKGGSSPVVRVLTCADMCAYTCGPPLGSRHIIYAQSSDGRLRTSICTRSSPELAPHSDLRILRRRACWWRSPVSSLRVIRWWRQRFG